MDIERSVNNLCNYSQGMALSLGDKINKIQNVSHQKATPAF